MDAHLMSDEHVSMFASSVEKASWLSTSMFPKNPYWTSAQFSMYTPVHDTGCVDNIFCRRHGTKTASASSLITQSNSVQVPLSPILFHTCLNKPVFTHVFVFFLFTRWNSPSGSSTLMASYPCPMFTSISENTSFPGQLKTPTPLLNCSFSKSSSSSAPGCLLGFPLSWVCTVKQ